jgi:hypothetical protein
MHLPTATAYMSIQNNVEFSPCSLAANKEMTAADASLAVNDETPELVTPPAGLLINTCNRPTA